MNASTHNENRSHLGAWIFASVLVLAVAVCVIVALLRNAPESHQQTAVNNTAALQACVEAANKKYDPIIVEATATNQPNAQSLISAKQADVQTCKVEYPTN